MKIKHIIYKHDLTQNKIIKAFCGLTITAFDRYIFFEHYPEYSSTNDDLCHECDEKAFIEIEK